MSEQGALTSTERRRFNELVTVYFEYDAYDPRGAAGRRRPPNRPASPRATGPRGGGWARGWWRGLRRR